MLFAIISLFLLWIPGSNATPSTLPSRDPVVVPGTIAAFAEKIQSEKSRTRRIELLGGLITQVREQVAALPDSIDESETPRVEMLYELHILLGQLKPDTLNPATCPNVLRAMRQMTNPNGLSENQLTSSGRLVLDVVKSVCAP